MKYFIRKVNGKTKQKQKVLLRLQKEILPSDRVCDTKEGHWWIVYTETNKAVGFAGLKQSNQFGDCAFFHRSGVSLEHTGNGLQKRLIKARIRKAKSMGFNWVVSDTTTNPASANSLIHCGFKMYEPSKPWGWEHTCYWRLKL
jgi:N-acetylglutamate synthase-like GNAT family acetyltransferase